MPNQGQTDRKRSGCLFPKGIFLGGALGAIVLPVLMTGGCSQPATDDDDMAATRILFETQGKDTVDVPTTSALLGTAPKRTRTAVAMLFNIGSAPNSTAVSTLLMGPGTSLTRMYNEISYGLQQLQIDLSGPYMLPVANCLTIACCGPSSDRVGNGATVAAEIAALPKVYDHYFWDYGLPLPSGANCGTWGDEGSPATPAKYSSYSFQGIVGQAQELGHNLGMTHEPTLKCAGNATFLDDSTQCTHVEYGSTLSFMGNGGVGYHPSAYHKFAQGWIGGCNVVKVGASGTFNLVPQELACNGAQLLQIAAPKVRPAPAAGDRQGTGPMLSNYYVEMRTPIGFDAQTTRGFKQPMVVISIGADLPTTTRAAPYLYVLDMVPEAQTNLANAGLMTVGQSYADPGGGLTITLTAISAMTATITVTTTATGANTCVDATAFSAPGMDGTSCSALATSDGGTIVVSDAGAPSDAVVGGTGGRAGGAGGGAGGAGGARGGAGGAPGTGGAIGTGSGGAGTGGATPTGSGGSAVATGGSTGTPGGTGGRMGTPAAGNAVSSGCACTTSSTSDSEAGLFASLLVAAGLIGRRRSRRAGR